MNIQMIGIDYTNASLKAREIFSLTQNRAIKTAKTILQDYGADGCIVLSTCNRTEIWISGITTSPLLKIFCSLKQQSPQDCAQYFVERNGMDAVSYLFSLTSGLESQIFGEDQILTQVKQSLSLAREARCVDTVLEVLFRSAITCAKKIKSTIRLTATDISAPAQATTLLKSQFGSLADKRCLVIGNGEMGRLSASCLVNEGATVFMTLRQYKRGDVLIPAGVDIVHYDERYRALENVDLVISATLSPHYTLVYNQVEEICRSRPITFVDLAVPRDIEPSIQDLPLATVYDIDTLSTRTENQLTTPEKELALQIISTYSTDFDHWYSFRHHVDTTKRIAKLLGKEARGKLKTVFKQLHHSDLEKHQLQKSVESATTKTTAKLLYGLRDYLPPEYWDICLTALEKSAKDFQNTEK